MVVFTCNHCGESLQKPKVEKHYQFSCKNPIFVTCVDCLKDFRGNEFDVHIKCCTEDERYGAKGTVNVVKKGEVKQESWIEMIRSIINEEPTMKAPHRNLLNKISTFTNVPRKKPKFLNFIKSSYGGRINMADVEAVWDIIEKYKARHCAKNVPNAKENKTKNSLSIEQKNGKADSATLADVDSGVSDNKKKKKKKDSSSEESTIKEDQNKVVDETVKAEKKAKRKYQSNTDNLSVDDNLKQEDLQLEGKLKKKKRKSQNEPDELSNKTGVNGEIVENEHHNGTTEKKQSEDVLEQQKYEDSQIPYVIKENGKAQKKAKRKSNSEENSTKDSEQSVSVPEDLSQQIGKEKKKTKRKSSIQAEDTADAALEKKVKQDLTETHGANGSSDQSEFDFQGKIIEILQNVDSISPDKLQKKIKKMYLKQTGETEFSEKVLKKYNKKLKRIANIEVTETSVKLIEAV